MTISQYYTKLKKAWDELNYLMPLPSFSRRSCTCENVKAIASIFSSHQLMQFLMGLNESFDSVRSQILLLDPFPSVNKVYSMVLRIEKQREVTDISTTTIEDTTLFARSSSTKSVGRYQCTDPVHTKGPPRGSGDSSNKGYGLRTDSKKPFRHCDYCNVDGHVRDTCFCLHGFPKWYKDYKAKTYATNMANTPLHIDTPPPSSSSQIQDIAAPYPLTTSGVTP